MLDVTSPQGALAIGGGVVTLGGVGASIHGFSAASSLGARRETVRVLEQADTLANEFGAIQAAANRPAPGHAERVQRIAAQIADARSAVQYAESKAPMIRNLGIGAAVLGVAAIGVGLFVLGD